MNARPIIVSIAAITVIGVAGVYAYAQSQKPLLELGVGYAARVACGCRYIGNRSIGDCRKDFEPGMEAISLSDDPARKTVTASVPLVARRSVRFDPVLGCQAQPLK